MLYSIALAAGVVFALSAASMAVERLLRRSRKEFRKPGWFVLFYALLAPGFAMVYFLVSVDSPLLYAAYALAGGVAALAAQCFYGVKLPVPPEKPGNA